MRWTPASVPRACVGWTGDAGIGGDSCRDLSVDGAALLTLPGSSDHLLFSACDASRFGDHRGRAPCDALRMASVLRGGCRVSAKALASPGRRPGPLKDPVATVHHLPNT
jgi:hypothetical protein